MPVYQPDEFVSRLASDELTEPLNLVVYGPVKVDPDDSSVLLLSISRECQEWLSIPLASIDSIQHGSNISCKEHHHPFAKITLKTPDPADTGAALFARLFAHASAGAAAARLTALRSTKASAADGGCETFTFDDVPYVCCPPASGTGSWDCTILL